MKLTTIEFKKFLLIFIIGCCAFVIIIFWHQMGIRPVIPHVVYNTVRKIYSPSKIDDNGDTLWTWKCVDKRCQRIIFDYSSPITSKTTCSMLCGSSQLWPQPTGKVKLGTKTITFYQKQMQLQSTVEEPARSLLEKSYAVFNSNIEAIQNNVNNNVDKENNDESDIDKFLINVNIEKAHEVVLGLNTDESYELSVKLTTDISHPDRVLNVLLVDIKSRNFYGARHGLETLSQLIWFDEHVPGVKQGLLRTFHNANIKDRPVFAYRGLMLDTARNYMPLEDIKRTLDGMSASKLNVFHWHITDSQSFPLKLPSVPQLAEHGAYSSSMVYEAEQVADLVEYARIRGIRVMIEIDTPAHAGNGWQFGPGSKLGDLAYCINQQPWSLYCGEPPCGQLNPKNPNVYEILEKIYLDLLQMGSDTEIFHLGGDEVNIECWTQHFNKDSTSSNYTDMHETWGEYTMKAIKKLEAAYEKYGKKQKLKNIIMWSSNLSKRPYLQKFFDKEKVVIQSWGASTWPDTQDLLVDGYRVLISHVDAWYLDCGFGRWRETGDAACDPYRPWQTMYLHRPWISLQSIVSRQLPQKSAKNFDVKKQIIGGEVCLWTEQVESTSLDSRVFPRASAFSERLWSDPGGNTPPNNNPNSFLDTPYEDPTINEDVYTRLSTHRERLVKRGVNAEAMWPKWCDDNPGMCL